MARKGRQAYDTEEIPEMLPEDIEADRLDEEARTTVVSTSVVEAIEAPSPAVEATGEAPEPAAPGDPPVGNRESFFMVRGDAIFWHWKGEDYPPRGDGSMERPFRSREQASFWAKRSGARYVVEVLDQQGHPRRL